ncbi:MAG TPA: hypothetical protein VIO60_03515, partial [Rectinemataceae bacterium]
MKLSHTTGIFSRSAFLLAIFAIACAFAPAAQEADAASSASEYTEDATAPGAQAAPATTAAPAAIHAAEPLQFYEDAPEADRKAVETSRVLSGEGKWLSAWKSLAEYDAAGANPWILAEKVRLAAKGYAQTMMHMVFAFADLAEGEDLESLRQGVPEDLEPVEFNPAESASAIEKSGEAMPAVLSLALGDFYFDVWTLYQGQWMQEDAAILGMAAEYYERAFAYDTFTAESLTKQSDVLVALQRLDAAEAVVKKGLELEPGSVPLSLKLGDILLGQGRNAEVYLLADSLVAAASAPGAGAGLGAQAYILGIKAGLAALDREGVEKYLAGYEASFPGEIMPGLVRHLVLVRLGDAAGADAAADAVTAAFPGNPDVIRSILSTWLSVQDAVSGFRYLDRSLAKEPQGEAAAALYFYRALLGAETAAEVGGIEAALIDLAKAEEY